MARPLCQSCLAALGGSQLQARSPSPPGELEIEALIVEGLVPGGTHGTILNKTATRARSRPVALIHLSLLGPPPSRRPTPRRRRREDNKRWERSRSMKLWQMDVMGGSI